MTSDIMNKSVKNRRFLGVFAMTVMLAACIGNDDNSATSGLVVHVAEIHNETSVSAKAASRPVAAHTIVAGGYDSHIEHHTISDKNHVPVDIYRAYMVINNIELVPCASLAQLPRQLLDGLVSKAAAHAGHGSEPVGGRALDAPNVIDIVTQDGYILPLGDMAIAPGRYCGVRVSLTRLANIAYGKPDYQPETSDGSVTVPEVPDMSGLMFALRADYCDTVESGACTHRTRVDLDDGGLNEPMTRMVEFDTPLQLNAGWREGYVIVEINYGEWLNDVDVTQLAGNDAETAKVLDNILSSIRIYQKGLGELPPN